MGKKQILLICGGGGSEHDVSLVSAKFIEEQLAKCEDFETHLVTILANGDRIDRNGNLCELRRAGELFFQQDQRTIKLDFAIPCIHGFPGETGEIQAVFELMGLPYLGSGPEASILCFNKISTKLWFDALNIPNTPFLFLSNSSTESIERAEKFFDQHKDIFIKAASQGSSIGCFQVTNKENVKEKILEAFNFSPYVLIEKTLKARELEVAVYEIDGKVHATAPGEISCPDGFYTYEEKYSGQSHTETHVVAQKISKVMIEEIKTLALHAFKGLKLRHLSRIDFFLDHDGNLFLNEINTFPGHTSISMFPMMMKNNGHEYSEFLKQIINNETNKK